ncbi:hypothetical protein [Photobacterium galatheae]|uniref:hypothetical protein n=1 Tax=Photobacterium galatheae TaxID=1654360 RepID=UPI0012686F5D|nr:hypothetical protein [Photobacterium galatheae]MCM0147749.1 hypothetical protein [Photobacterium galatheae]
MKIQLSNKVSPGWPAFWPRRPVFQLSLTRFNPGIGLINLWLHPGLCSLFCAVSAMGMTLYQAIVRWLGD